MNIYIQSCYIIKHIIDNTSLCIIFVKFAHIHVEYRENTTF